MLVWTNADQFCKKLFISNSCGGPRDDPEACQPDFEALWSLVDHLWTRSSPKGSQNCATQKKEGHHWQHSIRFTVERHPFEVKIVGAPRDRTAQ